MKIDKTISKESDINYEKYNKKKRTPTPINRSTIKKKRTPTPINRSTIKKKRTPTPINRSTIKKKRTPTPINRSTIKKKRTPVKKSPIKKYNESPQTNKINIIERKKMKLKKEYNRDELCDEIFEPYKKLSHKDITFFTNKYRNYVFKSASKLLPKGLDKEVCYETLIDTKFTNNIKKIGEGGYGVVYLLDPICGDFPIVIKDAELEYDTYERTLKGHNAELIILKLLTQYLYLKTIQNFPMLYSYNICIYKETEYYLELYLEKFDGTLSNILYGNNTPDKLLENILLQCLLSLAFVQYTLGLSHSDLKSSNFLYRKIPAGGYWLYNFRGVNYYVENLGYIVSMSDFGLCTLCIPKFSYLSSRNIYEYGDRSVKIVNNKILEIKHKYKLKKHYSRVIKLKDNNPNEGFHLHNNLIDLEPEEKIDLDDIDTFPPTEFLNDILDVIRMFIGGLHTMEGYMTHKSSNIKRKQELKELIKYDTLKDLYGRKNRSYMFSADKMLKKLFPETKIPKSKLLDVFVVE